MPSEALEVRGYLKMLSTRLLDASYRLVGPAYRSPSMHLSSLATLSPGGVVLDPERHPWAIRQRTVPVLLVHLLVIHVHPSSPRVRAQRLPAPDTLSHAQHPRLVRPQVVPPAFAT